MSVRVNVCICVYMCVCVCTRSYNSWTAAAMDFNIIFTDRDKPFFILYFQAVPWFPLQMCSSRTPTPTPARVPPEGGQDICAAGRISPLFRSDRRIPGPPRPPIPSAALFSVTIFPPLRPSPLRQLAARAPPLAATQPRLLGPGRATKPGARGGATRACARRRAYTRNQPSLASGTRARAVRTGRASPSTSTSALSALAPTRSRRG